MHSTHHFPLLVFISFNILAASVLHSQVTIRERVKITPKQNPQPLLSTQGGGVFQVQCSYSGSIDPDRPNLFYLKNVPCGVNLGGKVSGTLTATAYTGVYTVGYRFSVPRTGGGGQFRFAIYLDSDILKETSFPVSCPTGCTLMTEEYIPLYVGFAITPTPGQILHEEMANLAVSPVSSPTPYLTTVWHPEVPVTLTITVGSELGEFVDQDGNSLGQSVTRKGSQIGTIRFAANGEQPQGAQGTVTIDASSRDITKTITITVVRTTPLVDHFAITLEHDEIAYTETSKIFVQAKDANDQDIEFDDSEKLLFYLTTNPEYGTFIDANGDTVSASPPCLPNARYGDAREGKIRFAAVKTNPKTQATSVIRVEWQQDATKMGEKEITILEKTLKIVMTGPREVRPLIPEEIIKLPGNQGSIIPSRAMTELRVQLTRGGIRIGGHPFRLSSDYIDGSGGHDHVTPRRPRTLDNYGSFALKQTPPSQPNNPFEGTTALGGEGNIVYTASVFGDRMLFTTQSRQIPLLWDTLSIVEHIPDLHPLDRNEHLIIYTSSGTIHRLSNSNYGTEETLNAASAAVAQYAREYGMEHGIYLAVIDMSLPQGGLFDIGGNWLPPHNLHRTGKSVDFSHFYKDASGQKITVNIYVDGELWETTDSISQDRLDFFFEKAGFNRLERNINKIHYESRD